MSTSLLYHGFGIRGYRYLRTEYVEGSVMFHIEQPWESCRCAACGSDDLSSRGQVERLFRSVPIGKKAVWIRLPIPRVECKACGVVRQVNVRFADSGKRYTHAFARYVLDLSRHMTIQAVAQHLGCHWDTVKEIQRLEEVLRAMA